MVGHGITYVLSILFARGLGVDGFEAYVVAAAAFILMLHVAPLGLDKYAIRLLPALFERGDWARAAGFQRFAARRILRASALIMAAAMTWMVLQGTLGSPMGRALFASVVSLPAAALVQLLAGVLAAAGGEARANLAVRVAVPLCTLGFVGMVAATPTRFTGALAIACWGAAWMVVWMWLSIEAAQRQPPEALAAAPLEEPSWAAEARTFWVYGFAMALMGQAGVVALELLQPSAVAVGAYGAAMSTASTFVAAVAATNGLYARRISVLLERGDVGTLARLGRDRGRWLIPLLGVFVAVVSVFPAEILGLFRPEFIEIGVAPLRILAIAVSVTLLFALSPTYLKYLRRNRALFTVVLGSTALQIALLVWLVPRFGATGAAVAYAVSTTAAYAIFTAMRTGELRRLGADGGS
jgi:O-antigen/teichoic acid export membrane protein